MGDSNKNGYDSLLDKQYWLYGTQCNAWVGSSRLANGAQEAMMGRYSLLVGGSSRIIGSLCQGNDTPRE